jgi:hypothetical protein
MQGHSVHETYLMALKTIHGTDKDLWQRESNQASLILAGNFTPQVEIDTFNTSIDRLTEHVLVDTHAAFLQKRYIERHLFLWKTGVRAFCERVDGMFSYLPLFPATNVISEIELTYPGEEKKL